MRVSRCLVVLFLWAVALAVSETPVAQASAIPVFLDQRPLALSAPSVLIEDRILVPVRGFVESMGGQVSWDPSGWVVAYLRDRVVTLTIGSMDAKVGEQSVALDVPAQLIGSRTYIPLRFVTEGLGAAVHFDGTSVHISSPRLDRIVVFDGPLNVRQHPSTSSAIVTTVPAGTRFVVEQQSGEWSRVVWQGGRTGWVATRFTKPETSINVTAPFLEGSTGYLQVQGECLGATPIIGGRVFVPVRHAVERLGGQVSQEFGQTRVRYRGQEVLLAADIWTAQVNGLVVSMTDPPVLRGGELFVPARSLADWLNLGLQWDGARQTAMLDTADPLRSGGIGCNPAAPVGAYVVLDAATGVVLAEQRADERRLIASTTKIMTALLTVEKGNLDDIVTVSTFAASTPLDGTRMGLRAGERIPLRDMLYGLMLRSGNDAATAIGEHLAGSEYNFARDMTNRAHQLGAVSTNFLNASGLDDFVSPKSTARDLGLIAWHGMQHPDFRAVVSAKAYQAPGAGGRQMLNRNDFVLTSPGATGIKNGWTPAAGHTLVASAYRSDREVIVVVLGALTRNDLYLQANRLMDQGFRIAHQSWMLGATR